jgi:L-ascorbate metabolism protein UlaG (beta-lactamase superfamily)
VQILVPAANRHFVADRLGCSPDWLLCLDDGEELEAAGFRVLAVPAAHEQIERDELGRSKYLGYVVSCLQPGGQKTAWTIYHSGDTVWYEGIVPRLAGLGIDLALLPINGRAPARRVAGNLDGREAAELAHAIGARLVVPCHYDMFTFNTADPGLFTSACAAHGQPYTVLAQGARLDLPG